METSLVFFIVAFVVVASIVIQLCSHRKDKYQRLVHSLFYRTQRPGGGAWGLGPWYYGAWDVGEKVNESITEGRVRFSHQQSRHYHISRKHHRKHQ